MILACALFFASLSQQQVTNPYDAQVAALRSKGLKELGAYALLDELTSDIGARVDGSPAAARAVEWGAATMKRLGFQNVRLVECMVPHWVRGREEATMQTPGGTKKSLKVCALGGSIGTGPTGITADVIEVHSVDECKALGSKAEGKIVFFNGAFDSTLTSTFGQYGGAVGQRVQGAATAAKLGAVGVVVRSMTGDPDDVPHTGVTRYDDGGKQIPAAALSIVAANALSQAVQSGRTTLNLTLTCKTLPDEPSANVVGEIVGSEKPNEIVLMGGHLDSWDKGTGAHDDGAGVVHALEALRLLHDLGWKPKRTIRVVLFMDEEHTGKGAEAYAAFAAKDGKKHIAAIESDSGGFAPRGFGSSLTAEQVGKIGAWITALSAFEAEKMGSGGGGGADVGPLGKQGAVLFGLQPESQRYFDYHHSDKDTLDKVNPRELELGALSLAMLAWLLSEEGIP